MHILNTQTNQIPLVFQLFEFVLLLFQKKVKYDIFVTKKSIIV